MRRTLTASILLLAICASVAVGGCDDGNNRPAPASPPAIVPIPFNADVDPTALAILENAAGVTAQLQSYHFTYSLGSSGDFLAPDRCRTRGNYQGNSWESTQIGNRLFVQQSGGDVYEEHVLEAETLVPCQEAWPISERGILSSLTRAAIAGEEQLEGEQVVRIEYTRFFAATGPPGASKSQELPGEIWIEKQSNRILKWMPVIHEPEVYYTYSGFNEPVTPPIERPAKVTPYISPVPAPGATTVLPH